MPQFPLCGHAVVHHRHSDCISFSSETEKVLLACGAKRGGGAVGGPAGAQGSGTSEGHAPL